MYETPLIFESDAPKKVYISQLSLNIVITPRREVALRSSVPFTPCGNEAHRYCYYCPLCMEFFESILKTKCCGNYICLKCTLEYLNAKGLLAESVKELVGNNQLKSVCCPHCFTIGFDPQFVESEESIRDYSKGIRPLLMQSILKIINFILCSMFFLANNDLQFNFSRLEQTLQ